MTPSPEIETVKEAATAASVLNLGCFQCLGEVIPCLESNEQRICA